MTSHDYDDWPEPIRYENSLRGNLLMLVQLKVTGLRWAPRWLHALVLGLPLTRRGRRDEGYRW